LTAVARPADVTVGWLSAVVGTAVSGFTVERIGTGQMSECYRVALRYPHGSAGPASVVLKVAAGDTTSRQTGLALGLYEHEVRFYTDIAPRLSAGPVARCHHAAFDPETGVFDLVLGDAAPALVGDEIRGATIEQAHLAVGELARLQAPLLGDATLAGADWLTRASPLNQALVTQLYAGFADRYGESMTAGQRAVCEQLVAAFDGYLAQEAAPDRPRGLVHGDYRLDNMLFGEGGAAAAPLTVVDWQTVTWGPALTDLSYFLGCALPVPQRRQHDDELLRTYHRALGPAATLSLDDIRDGVRRASFFGVVMAIVSSMLVRRTDRGDEMFMTMLERHCSQVLDTGALAALPSPVAVAPLQPGDADEAAHPATDEPLWSESWYGDFVDPAQRIGGWVRLGLIPNQGAAWLQAFLCGPDMPTIAVSDFTAALPDNAWTLRTEEFEFSHAATIPLRTYAVVLHGRGQAYDDPSALLRGRAGRPVEVSLELAWNTDGTPYQYRLTPRYEIACTVSGSVTADGHTYRLDAVPGQRDHSWGVRDWWSMEWVWSALHLDDGTHLHGLDLRIPGGPPIGVGYCQPPAASLVELQTVEAREAFAPNGLPVATRLSLQPGDIVVSAEVLGQAPVLLTSWDGRVSEFPRGWATVSTADGRSGVGWLEWNRNRT
jgi:hypothetical protein